MVEDVRLAVEGSAPVAFHGRTGGMVPAPDEVLGALRRLWAVTTPRSTERIPHRTARSAPPEAPPRPVRPKAEAIEEPGDPALQEVWR